MSDRVQSTTVDLNHQLLDTLDALRSSVGKRVTISLTLATNLGAIHVDPNAMRRTILDLARTANAAMSGEGSLLLETGCARLGCEEDCGTLDLPPGEYVCLAVSDTSTVADPGPGSEFSTALRLAPVYAFAKRNGGAATIINGPNGGTTISLYFPKVPKGASAQSIKDADDLGTEFLRMRWQGISSLYTNLSKQTAANVLAALPLPRGSLGLPPAWWQGAGSPPDQRPFYYLENN